MMWHFYEIPYIPDLELVKYQSLGEQGIDGILERHNRFLRQWQRNTVLIHTTLHFFLSYTHERPKGRRLQIFLAFSSDQTVNFESIDALMQASPLADYYKIAPIEDVPVCLRKSFTNILLVKKQEQTRLSTGDTLFTVEGWKSNPKSRLYEMEKTAEALNEDMVYHISIYGSDTYKTAQQALQKPIAILREKALAVVGKSPSPITKIVREMSQPKKPYGYTKSFYQMLPNRLVFLPTFYFTQTKKVVRIF